MMNFSAASITSAFGCWRSLPMREIFSSSIKMSASKVSEAVMRVPFLIKIVIGKILYFIVCFNFLYSQQSHQYLGRNIYFWQIRFIELLILRTFAQGSP